MSRRLQWLGLTLLLAVATDGEAVSMRGFPYSKYLRLRDKAGDGIGRFELDEEVLAVASAGYGNMRVFNENQRDVPFAVAVNARQIRTYRGRPFETEQDGRNTRVMFEARGLPINELVLQTPDRDFVRTLTIEGADAGDSVPGWRRLARGSISAVFDGTDVVARLSVALAAAERCTKYRLSIENEDNAPLRIDGVAVKGPVVEVRFLGNSGGEFQLLYGGNSAAPRYDIARVLAASQQRREDTYALDWQEANPGYSPVRAAGSSAGRVFMLVAMVLALLTLGWLVLVSLRKVDRLTPQ